ncbi:MAG: hypothetical protein LBS58_03675 [Coriobacteriales bacterium]|jgi:hypothetical protein|nr:hypothetical protein [Coriobacteriales bacterium]
MKTLQVPTASISEVKRSPSRVFKLAAEANTGVYIFSHGNVTGVMLAQEQYEGVNERLKELEEELFIAEVARRTANEDAILLTDEEVRGKRARADVAFDQDDGWE